MLIQAQNLTPDDLNPEPNSQVFALAVQTNGQLLVGGTFSTLGGQARVSLGRLNADGSPDSTFNPSAVWVGPSYTTMIRSLVVQPDGKVLVAGGFTMLDGQPGFGTNGFGFNLTWAAGQSVVVETSSDLLNWVPLQTNVLTAATFFFADPVAPRSPHQFYRVLGLGQ